MNNQTKRWEVLNKGKTEDIVKTLLKNRGLKTKKDIKEFLSPIEPEKISLKELGISQKETKKAIKRIKKAIKNKEKAIIYGDYDADGICGTAILWEALYSLGLKVLPYIPERFSEGYGLNTKSVEKLKSKIDNLKLIITVDNGIVAYAGIKKAKKLGIEVIVTDHHLPGKTKPKALAIVHSTKISGAGVAWVLAREIFKNIQHTTYNIQQSLELAAIGTIADQMPLIGPSRSFVKYGLEKLNKTKRPGLLALFEEARIGKMGPVPRSLGEVGTYEINYMIAPRLNAMGRLVHGIDSLRLLCTKNSKQGKELALLLGKTNTERQQIVEKVVLHARKSLDGKIKEGIIILGHEEYHEGVIGLAASKLVEEFYRPAIVLSRKGDISKASARSISGFNIIEAIRKLEGLYIEGGGHPMAAGFSIETAKIPEFTQRINELAKPLLTEEILTKKLKIDLEINFNQINYELLKKLKEFEPTGIGNSTPTFVSKKVEIVDARTVGHDGSHLKMKLKQGEVIMEAIAFGFGGVLKNTIPVEPIDVVYSIEEDNWNGYQKLQLKIKDIRF
jgi:single-stranded-DNA-specific exonuclease